MDAHLRDLRYFVAVAEELSFTRAAERLYLSQPALSKQVRGLESALGAQLFHREPQQIRLTSAGTVLLALARQMLSDWDDGMAAVADAASEDTQVLRVGTLTAIGRDLYPAIVEHFDKRQPGWRIELRSHSWGDATAGLADKSSDVAFLWLPLEAENIDYDVIATERRYVVVSSQHHLAHRTEVKFVDIAEESFVALPRSAGPLRDFWLGGDQPGHRPVRVVAEVSSADEKFEVVASGSALAMVAEGNALVYSRPGIQCIPVTDLPPAKLVLAWRHGEQRVAVQDFIRACSDALRS